MKFVIFSTCLLLTFFIKHSSSSFGIACNFSDKPSVWYVLDQFYRCEIIGNPIILTKENAYISFFYGEHKEGKTDEDVNGIYAYEQNISYFLHGFEKSFNNIKGLSMYRCGVKEIHQDELRHYPKLIELQMYSNLIEVLEVGLFDFNPELKYVDFESNKISNIYPDVFDHLSNLATLNLFKNKCTSVWSRYNLTTTQQEIAKMKLECPAPTTTTTTTTTTPRTTTEASFIGNVLKFFG